MYIDLHTHTRPWSDDSLLDIPTIVRLAKQAGLDAICLTEHDWFRDRDNLTRLSEEHEFLILPGVETNTDDGHFLVFGLEKYTFGMHRTRYLKQLVDEAEGAMILAHPYRRNFRRDMDVNEAVDRYCRQPLFEIVDTIEVCNGRAVESENRFSQELRRRLNLRGVGGSDAHSTTDMPSYATHFEKNIKNVGELITELKAGRFKPVDLRTKS